jgi:hypothetical protein
MVIDDYNGEVWRWAKIGSGNGEHGADDHHHPWEVESCFDVDTDASWTIPKDKDMIVVDVTEPWYID